MRVGLGAVCPDGMPPDIIGGVESCPPGGGGGGGWSDFTHFLDRTFDTIQNRIGAGPGTMTTAGPGGTQIIRSQTGQPLNYAGAGVTAAFPGTSSGTLVLGLVAAVVVVGLVIASKR